ncbi:hypothetical protein PIB30_094643 [Stylosanthes scabra]|uniref:Uncharacterized protein n=1 Tax=Stylosanthes scabra TaxID=79078 RepID=A0ABU6WTQ8_9FABA|nr:hypothetical protein [Stylosanthes scabra]
MAASSIITSMWLHLDARTLAQTWISAPPLILQSILQRECRTNDSSTIPNLYRQCFPTCNYPTNLSDSNMQIPNRTVHNNLTDNMQLQQQENVDGTTRRCDYLTSQGQSHQPLTAGTEPTRLRNRATLGPQHQAPHPWQQLRKLMATALALEHFADRGDLLNTTQNHGRGKIDLVHAIADAGSVNGSLFGGEAKLVTHSSATEQELDYMRVSNTGPADSDAPNRVAFPAWRHVHLRRHVGGGVTRESASCPMSRSLKAPYPHAYLASKDITVFCSIG